MTQLASNVFFTDTVVSNRERPFLRQLEHKQNANLYAALHKAALLPAGC